jgi:hypothetical protein
VLLVALSAVVGMFVAPAAVAASTATRPSVAGSPHVAPVAAPTARPAPRETQSVAARRAARASGSLPASVSTPSADGTLLGSVPVTAVAAVLALAGCLAVLRAARVRPARGAARVRVGTPGRLRGRAPPAYATA